MVVDRRSHRALLFSLFLLVSYLLWTRRDASGRPVRGSSSSSERLSSHHAARPADAAPKTLRKDELDLNALDLEPANATLGFGAVIAVSREGSPRREGLILAANITEIDITIPFQPAWTDENIAELRASAGSTISRGSALAWLGHLNALQWFLQSDLETVLIVEDDVDWDIHLRMQQVPKAAAAIRHLVARQTHPPGPAVHEDKVKNSYWGLVNSWDIIYLGHCGDIFKPTSWTSRVPRIVFRDHTMPPHKALHPYTQKFLEDINIPDDNRVIHQSIFPLCTFGFAVTRPAAYKLLSGVAAHESEGGTWAYDVRVLEACRDLGFRCWSTTPELFHHLQTPSEIAGINAEAEEKPEGEGEGEGDGEDAPPQDGTDPKTPIRAGVDEKGRLKPLRAGRAPNIACGVRDRNFFTRDPRTLEYLRQKVGREGKCLRDEVEEDMGRAPGEGEKWVDLGREPE